MTKRRNLPIMIWLWIILEDCSVFVSLFQLVTQRTSSLQSDRWRNLAYAGSIRFLIVLFAAGSILLSASQVSANCGSVKRELNYQFFQTAPNFDILIALNAESDEKLNRAPRPDRMNGKSHDGTCTTCRGQSNQDRPYVPAPPATQSSPRIALIGSNFVITTIGRDVRETVRSEIVLLDSASLESLERPPISC